MMDSMELGDSPRSNSETTGSDVAIDHNGVFTASASTDENMNMAISAEKLVRSFHTSTKLPSGAPAELPRKLNGSACEACGRPEAEGCVVVCDGCERGFHVGCLGMLVGEAIELEEWICGKCSGCGVRSNRWNLGWRNKRRRVDTDSGLDITGKPQSEGEAEGCKDSLLFRKHIPGDNPFGGNLFGLPVEVTNLQHFNNSFGSQEATDTVKLQFVPPSLGAVDSCLKGLKGENNSTTMGSSTKDLSEMYFLALKEYLKEEHVLVEGWHVEFEHNSATRELCPVYVTPDGKRLGSVSEVASYLKSITTNMPTQCGTGKYDDGLPIQYGDFFVLSVGEVDARHSYHCRNQIWPVGYSSCWHDKVTGSLFMCHVQDGGDSGPLFKVKRSPCSALPIPNPLQVLYQAKHGHSNGQNERSDVLASQSMDYEDLSIMSMLAEPPAPFENDILSCLVHSSDDYLDMQGSHDMLTEKSHSKRNQSLLSDCSPFGHDADIFSVEESSSALAWRVMSRKILKLFREIYTQTGVVKFFCKHILDTSESFCCDVTNEGAAEKYASLARFYGLPTIVNIPYIIQADMQLEVVAQELLKWLDQDRFGLDAEFVQEIIEQKQDVRDSFGYVPLNQRSSFSSFITVGNSLLEGRAVEVESEEGRCPSHGLRSSNIVNTRTEEHLSDTRSLPPGRPFSTKMPSLLLGDTIQVLQFFWRFHEVLGLKKLLTFEDIEEELINPRCHGVDLLEKVGGEIHEKPFVIPNNTDGAKMHISSYKSGPEVDLENLHAFVQMERKSTEEASPMKLEFINSSKCSGSALTKAIMSTLHVLISELQPKVAVVGNVNFDIGDSRKRGRKKDFDYVSIAKRNTLSMLPYNELTWLELARRYALALLSMNGYFESTEITTHDNSAQVIHCLQGDGGALCGSLTGVAGIEVDALLLAKAKKRILGSLDGDERDNLAVDDEDSDRKSLDESVTVSESIPDWIQVLEPVRKLPTNVGARIKKCIYNALERSPPEWARKILEHSISKEVYKGNASGPTKRAVLSVLAQAQDENVPHKPVNEKKKKKFISISSILMKQCRLVLRHAIAADHRKVFCNLLGKRTMNYNTDGGIIGTPGMTSRPLDFRTIDQRLAVNAYGGVHKAFYEDACEVWSNVFIAFKHQPDLLQLAESLANNFKSLYDKKVATLSQKLVKCRKLNSVDASLQKEIENILTCSEIPKAPWEDGVCKVCGIDNDDKSVLLCDACDAEYHTYCLNPPLARIPSGNWYCPSCVTNKQMVSDAYTETAVVCPQKKKDHSKLTLAYIEAVAHLATVLETKEYWEISVAERTNLLKFLCDELLNSALLHGHLEQSAEDSVELQQKWRSLLKELKVLTLRENFLARKADDGSLTVGEHDVEVQESNETLTGNEKCSGYLQTTSHSGNHISVSNDDVPSSGDGQKCVDPNAFFKHLPADGLENSDSVDCQSFEPMDADDAEGVSPITGDGQLNESSLVNTTSSFGQNMDLLSCEETKGLKGDATYEDNFEKHTGRNMNIRNSEGVDGHHASVDKAATDLNAHLFTTSTGTVQAFNLSLKSVRDEILLMQNSITSLQKQLQKVSLRSEFLGFDSAGRLYWVVSMSDAKPCVIVNENVEMHQGEKITSGSNASSPPFWCKAYDGNNSVQSSWISYESDSEIELVLEFLKDNDPLERQLKQSILHWQKQRYNLPQLSELSLPDEVLDANLATRATSLLEAKCGSSIEAEATEFFKKQEKGGIAFVRDGIIYRCKCLEPIFSFERHYKYCRQTLSAPGELRFHGQDTCKRREKPVEVDNTSKQKGMVKPTSKDEYKGEVGSVDQTDGLECPFNLEDICSKFVIKETMKEEAEKIGLLGSSNGLPTFVPSLPPYLTDPASMLLQVQDNTSSLDHSADTPTSSSKHAPPTVHDASQNLPTTNALEERDTLKHDNCLEHPLVSQSALKPLVGEASRILRRLKINLLDMDAALPEQALRPSMSQIERRLAWRAFLKSAETIYQMVQALIVFEEMLKSDYLSNTWGYWSSISGAAKICTLSSLALRIYSLDAAIKYEEEVAAIEKTKVGRKVSKKASSSFAQ
nr:methyl-CpG-binding domain-containing protein 9 [Ipomoea batatas]